MAVYRSEFVTDIAKPFAVRPIAHQMAAGDADAYEFTVLVADSRAPETGLMAGSVSGAVVRPDGGTVVITGEKGTDVRTVQLPEGECNATPCTITIPQAALAYPGRVVIVIRLLNDTVETTVLAASATVARTLTGTVIDPGEAVPDITTLLAQIQACRDATTAAETVAETTLGNFAPEFDAADPYAAGSFVTNAEDGKLYLLPDGHTAGTSWANTTHVEKDFGAEVSDLKSHLVEQSEDQPTSPNNRIWFPSATPEGVEVPTFAEHEDLQTVVEKSMTDKNAQAIWEDGAITFAGGANTTVNPNTRIRTKTYIDDLVQIVSVDSGWIVGVFAYDRNDNDSYVGMWDGTEFQKTGQGSYQTGQVFVGKFQEAYKIRLVIGSDPSTTITTGSYSKAQLLYSTDKTLSIPGAPADAEAVGNALSAVNTEISTVGTNAAQINSDLLNSTINDRRIGNPLTIPSTKSIDSVKVYAKTAFSNLSPTYNNPSTYTPVTSTVLSLTTGKTEAEDISLVFDTGRTKTVNIDPIPTGWHTVTMNVSSNTADKATNLSFRKADNTQVANQAEIAAGATGKLVFSLEFADDASRIYAYINSSATTGAVTIESVVIDADLLLDMSGLYSYPLVGGGNYTYDGRQCLCDLYNFKTGKIERYVKVGLSGDVESVGYVNTNNGNAMFSIAVSLTNHRMTAYQPNYFVTHFTAGTARSGTDTIGSYYYNNSLRFRLPSSVASTSAEFLLWYKENSVTYFAPQNSYTTENISAEIMEEYANILQYPALPQASGTNSVGIEVRFSGAFDRSYSAHKSEPVISPENFGAVGDGVTDDTNALQAAIDCAIDMGGSVICPGTSVYGVTSLRINDRVTLDGQGSTFKALSANPIISIHRAVSQPNGYLKNITFDMDTKALSGLDLVNDWRGQYKCLTFLNPAVNGYGIRTYAAAGGCGFDTIVGKNPGTAGTTFIYLNSDDTTWNNIDYMNYQIGFDNKANVIIQNIHGFVAYSALFEDSIFIRTTRRMSIINPYPDTQRRFFVIDTNRGVTIVGGSSWYNKDVIPVQDFSQGYAFYTEDAENLATVSVIGFNFSQPSSQKPYMISNQTETPVLVACMTSDNSGATPIE